MPIVRTYECIDCKEQFEVECAPDDGDPGCPHCAVVLQWRPQRFAIGGSPASRAADITQKVMEQDYGLTNFKDAKHEGETAFMAPSHTTAENDQLSQQMSEVVQHRPQMLPAAKQFFQGGAAGLGGVDLSGIRAGPAAGYNGGRAINSIHNLGHAGKLPPLCKPIARG